MKELNINLEVTFSIIPFTPSENNQGRCIKCDGRNMCGLGDDSLKCPCGMNEQLRIMRAKTVKK